MKTKESNVLVRYDLEQKILHQKKAKEAGLSLSEYLRQSADNAEIIVKSDQSIGFRMIGEISRVGNNINQIAKVINKANLSGKVNDNLTLNMNNQLKLIDQNIKLLHTIFKLKGNS